MANRPKFNAAQLLNPKATAKQIKGDKEPANSYAMTEPTLDPEESSTNSHGGLASYIERHHGVENRSERPVKKIKRDHKPADAEEEEDDGRLVQFKKKSEGRNIAASGEMGQYMKQQREKKNGELSEPPLVDLTEDHSDVESTNANDQRNIANDTTEVCLGRIDGARVNCFKVRFSGCKTNTACAARLCIVLNPHSWSALLTLSVEPCLHLASCIPISQIC